MVGPRWLVLVHNLTNLHHAFLHWSSLLKSPLSHLPGQLQQLPCCLFVADLVYPLLPQSVFLFFPSSCFLSTLSPRRLRALPRLSLQRHSLIDRCFALLSDSSPCRLPQQPLLQQHSLLPPPSMYTYGSLPRT